MASQLATTLLIVGLTGDLGRRYLLPAIGSLAQANQLPENFRIVGITRRSGVDPIELVGETPHSQFLLKNLTMYQMDLDNPASYAELKDYLESLEQNDEGTSQRLYYLSVPPATSMPIVQQLGETGLAQVAGTKLLMEKPFGTDLATAKELICHVNQYFQADQVYRIDHYLAKEMVQNIMPFRTGNALLRRTWNGDHIKQIDILASEALNIEGRAAFYEQSGALRDLIQSHLLQIAALLLASLRDGEVPDDMPAARLQALRRLELDDQLPLSVSAVRGQYQGYTEQAENPTSQVETFAAITLRSVDPAWQGTVIRLITGKSLATKTTEIQITYRGSTDVKDQLKFRIQPDSAIEFGVVSKTPGFTNYLTYQALRLAYAEVYKPLPDAYERVIFDAISGHKQLFVTADEILETWRIVAPVLDHWQTPDAPLLTYQSGAKALDLACSKQVM